MPRLVKGGKYTFGWSRVGDMGRITVPSEALIEYDLQEGEALALESPLAAAAFQSIPLKLRRGGVEVPTALLARCGIKPGDRLLVIRGSGLASASPCAGRS